MGDMGAMYNDWKKHGQTRRANNRANSPTMLDEAGINYESKNIGSHLIVTGPECKVDFWPGTGRWNARNGDYGFGVKKLIKYIKGN